MKEEGLAEEVVIRLGAARVQREARVERVEVVDGIGWVSCLVREEGREGVEEGPDIRPVPLHLRHLVLTKDAKSVGDTRHDVGGLGDNVEEEDERRGGDADRERGRCKVG